MKRQRSKRSKIILGILIPVVLVIAVAAGIYIVRGKKKASTETVRQSTVLLTKMDLTESISATGTIGSRQTKAVSANLSNITIQKMLVEVGDEVQEGASLAVFDESDLQDALSDAEDALSEAQSSGDQEIASAQSQYNEALENQTYDSSRMNSQVSKALKEKKTAKAALAAARTKVKKLKGSKDEQKRTAAQEALTKAKEAYEQAKSALETARENRTSTNRQNKSSVSQAESSLESARSNAQKSIKEAQKQVDDAREALDNCSITAPISGVITAVNAQAGDTYSGDTLVQIDDTSSYTITTSVDEYDISSVEKGQRVVILTEATEEDELEGTITFVAPSTGSTSSGGSSSQSGDDAMSGSSDSSGYEIQIKVKTKDERLKLGLTAKCSIILDEAEDVFAVPYDAISENSDGSCYITVIDGDAMSGDRDGGMPEKDEEQSQEEEARAGEEQSKENQSEEEASEDQEDGGWSGQRPDREDRQNSSASTSGDSAGTRQITVTKGMESDYYVEISGDDLTEGLRVVVPTDATSESSSGDSDQSSAMGFGGMGGMDAGGMGGSRPGGNEGGNKGGGGAPGGGK